jgi:general secretion pathway protein C
MAARWLSFVIWAAVAAGAMFWLLRVTAQGPQAPGHTVTVGNSAAARADLSRVLGADAEPEQHVEVAAVPANARFRLIGVVAPRSGAVADGGLALIAVDDKPPRAYRVGAVVEGDTIVKSVGMRSVSLGGADGSAPTALELPPLPPPATGTLPAAGQAAPAPSPIRAAPLPGRPAPQVPPPAPVPPPVMPAQGGDGNVPPAAEADGAPPDAAPATRPPGMR